MKRSHYCIGLIGIFFSFFLNGVYKHYQVPPHVETYLTAIEKTLEASKKSVQNISESQIFDLRDCFTMFIMSLAHRRSCNYMLEDSLGYCYSSLIPLLRNAAKNCIAYQTLANLITTLKKNDAEKAWHIDIIQTITCEQKKFKKKEHCRKRFKACPHAGIALDDSHESCDQTIEWLTYLTGIAQLPSVEIVFDIFQNSQLTLLQKKAYLQQKRHTPFIDAEICFSKE